VELELDWPKGSSTQLLGVVRTSLRYYVAWRKASETWGRTHPEWQSFIEATSDSLHQGGQEFVEEWMERVHERIAGWEGWSGNLCAFAFHAGHKLFHQMVLTELEENGLSARSWENTAAGIAKLLTA